MNPPPPDPSDQAETSQAVSSQDALASGRRPAHNGVRSAGKWLMLLALGVLMAGLVAYKLILGDGLDNGTVFFPLALVISCFAVPLGLIGLVMWLIGIARSRRTGEPRS